jgi:hypothetical protein
MLDVGDALLVLLKVILVLGSMWFVLFALSGKFGETSRAIDQRIALADEIKQKDRDDLIFEEVDRSYGAPW